MTTISNCDILTVGGGDMGKRHIKLISNEGGDWEVLKVDSGEDFQEEGHSISNWDWIELLGFLGYNVEEIEISDEKMENGDY